MRPSLRVLVLGSAIAGILTGCGQRDALDGTAPLEEAPSFIENRGNGPSSESTTMAISRTLTQENGGELTIGNYRVSIPARALSSDATVTVRLLDAEFAWIRVTAETATLTLPISLTIANLDQTDASTQTDLAWCRPSGGVWSTLTSTRSGPELSAQSDSFDDFKVGVGQDGAINQWVRWLDGPGYQTRWIEAGSGGDVEYGRFKLHVPSDALASSTFITVRDSNAEYLECELGPHGLRFLAPVTLETDLNGTDFGGYQDWTTWWRNDSADAWEDQGGVFDSGRIVSELWHFSVYRPGRAGW